MNRRIVPVLLSLPWVLLALTAPADARAPRSTPRSPRVSDAQIANDVRFRQEFGLPADEAYVRALHAEASAGKGGTTTTYGALLTRAEEQSLAERTTATDHVVDIANEYFAAQPREILAAMYLDQVTGQVVVGVTRDLPVHDAALRAAVGDASARLSVRQLAYSLTELYRLQDMITAAIGSLEERGVVVTVVGVYEELNRVGVGVASDRTTATSVLRSQFGATAPITVDDATFFELMGVADRDSPPLRGGQRIIRSHETRPDYLGTCTSGFVGYVVDRLDAAIFSFNHSLITAGHCEYARTREPAAGSAPWQQGRDFTGSFFVGTSDRNTFANGSTADALRIPISSSFASAEVAVAAGDYRDVRCMDTSVQTKVGQPELISGYATGGYLSSGKLRRKGIAVRSRDEYGKVYLLKAQNEATAPVVGGDSGGSVIGTRECMYRAQGIVSSGGRVNGVVVSAYSPIYNVVSALGLAGVETTS